MSAGADHAGEPTIGLDIGGTNLRGAVIDRAGVVVADHREPSPHQWPPMREALLALVTTLRAGHAVAAIGIGAAGMVDRDGVIHYAPNVPGFLGTPVRAEIASATGLPTVVDNDANAAAWGELVHGAARGVDEALVITLGTGIGGGIVTGGRVMRGAHGFAAEIGHFTVDVDGPMCACGEVGHWEALASGTALGRMARETVARGAAPSVLAAAGGDVDAVTGHHVSDAARAGAPDALAIVDEYARNVSLGLVGLANILDPGVIVVSGGLVSERELLLEPIRRYFAGHLEGAEHRPTPQIVAAALGDRAGMIGAAVMARELAVPPPGRSDR